MPLYYRKSQRNFYSQREEDFYHFSFSNKGLPFFKNTNEISTKNEQKGTINIKTILRIQKPIPFTHNIL